jgi:pimeloyl-ACP methyl ester carboxylesterase
MVSVAKKTADLQAGTLAYLEAGEGEPVLYLHGAGGRPPAGATFVTELARSFHVFVPSRPGFDESPLGSHETLEAAANALGAFIEKSSPGTPVHVVAQSAGGAVGLWLAVRHPELVATLILSAPSAFAHRAQPAGQSRSPGELDKILYGDNPSWTEPPSQEEQDRIRKNAAFNMRQFSSPGEDLLGRLGDIEAPVLVLWGTEDRLVPSENSSFYQKHIPHAHRVLIFGAAHELPISATERWVALVTDFIRRGEFFVVNRARSASAPEASIGRIGR